MVKPEHRWLCLLVTVPRSDVDQAIELLWELGTVGIEEPGFADLPDPVSLRAFFPADRSPDTLMADARRLGDAGLVQFSSLSISQVISNPDDWVEDYKKNFHGFSIGQTFYVHPSWESPSDEHPITLVIDPGHAFGTGTHESTQLCLLALQHLRIRPRSILDVGTGSGILSIAARKLMPGVRITAIDNDPQAIEMSQENFHRNDVDDIRLAVAAPDSLRGHFDLILANLTEPIFRQLCGDLARLGRHLVVSGFTQDQAHLVLEYFAAYGLRSTQRWDSGGWVCLELSA